MKKTISEIVAILLLTGMLTLAFNSQEAWCTEPPPKEWDQTYGTADIERAWSMVETRDGGYAIAGYNISFEAEPRDFWLVKTDSVGNMQWNQTYGGDKDDSANSVVQTRDGGYAITGWTDSFGAGDHDFWLVKTNSTGHMQWNQTYGTANTDDAEDVIQPSDGGYAIAGWTGTENGPSDFWLVKANSTGQIEWNKTYHNDNNDAASAIIETGDGGYAIAGLTGPSGAEMDIWLVKTDSTGHVQWTQTYGGARKDYAHSIIETSDGGYAIAGLTYSFGSGGGDFWLVKTNSTGDMEWNHTYGEDDYDSAASLVETVDGGYAIGGWTNSIGAGSYDFWLVKTDSDGNVEWDQPYGEENFERLSSLVQTCDGGYAMAGYTKSFGAGAEDFWLVKLAPEEILATVDIDPDTLNLKSNGQWITAYIELPEEYSVSEIDVSSILLNGSIGVDPEAPTDVGDYDTDSIPDLMVKFDRAAVIEWLGTVDVSEDTGKYYPVTIEITGKVLDVAFEGTDMIKVLHK